MQRRQDFLRLPETAGSTGAAGLHFAGLHGRVEGLRSMHDGLIVAAMLPVPNRHPFVRDQESECVHVQIPTHGTQQ